MKKLLVVAMMLAISTGAFASNLWLGGNLSYNNTKTYNTDTTQQEFAVTPIIGYDINENWDCGLGLTFNYGDTNADNIVLSERTAAVTPFVRRKVASIGSLDFLALVGVNFEYGNQKGENMLRDLDALKRNYGINIAPVLKYNVCENLKVICVIDFLTLGYAHEETQYADGAQVKEDAFGFNVNNGKFITLGMEYHF